jgi:hypothetical protein
MLIQLVNSFNKIPEDDLDEKLQPQEEKKQKLFTYQAPRIERTLHLLNPDELAEDLEDLQLCIELILYSERKKNRSITAMRVVMGVILIGAVTAIIGGIKSKSEAEALKDLYGYTPSSPSSNQTCAQAAALVTCKIFANLTDICQELMTDYCDHHATEVDWNIAQGIICVSLFISCCLPLFAPSFQKTLVRRYNMTDFDNIYVECDPDDYSTIMDITSKYSIDTDMRRSKNDVLKDLRKYEKALLKELNSYNQPASMNSCTFFTNKLAGCLARPARTEGEDVMLELLPPPQVETQEYKVPDELTSFRTSY